MNIFPMAKVSYHSDLPPNEVMSQLEKILKRTELVDVAYPKPAYDVVIKRRVVKSGFRIMMRYSKGDGNVLQANGKVIQSPKGSVIQVIFFPGAYLITFFSILLLGLVLCVLQEYTNTGEIGVISISIVVLLGSYLLLLAYFENTLTPSKKYLDAVMEALSES